MKQRYSLNTEDIFQSTGKCYGQYVFMKRSLVGIGVELYGHTKGTRQKSEGPSKWQTIFPLGSNYQLAVRKFIIVVSLSSVPGTMLGTSRGKSGCMDCWMDQWVYIHRPVMTYFNVLRNQSCYKEAAMVGMQVQNDECLQYVLYG